MSREGPQTKWILTVQIICSKADPYFNQKLPFCMNIYNCGPMMASTYIPLLARHLTQKTGFISPWNEGRKDYDSHHKREERTNHFTSILFVSTSKTRDLLPDHMKKKCSRPFLPNSPEDSLGFSTSQLWGAYRTTQFHERNQTVKDSGGWKGQKS